MVDALRVLVVDDYPDAAKMSCALLSFFGVDCRWALSGATALEETARFDPHIVLLDLELPDISGYEVARKIRRQRGRELYMAAVTGWSRAKDRAAAIEAGFDHYVIKPTDSAKLRGIIQLATQLAKSRLAPAVSYGA